MAHYDFNMPVTEQQVRTLKIWLGDKPVDSDLKKAMLGPLN